MRMKVKTVVGVVLSIALIGGIAAGVLYTKDMKEKYEAQIAEQTNEINDLQSKINYVGELKTAYVLDCDVKGGTSIKESDLKEIQVPANIASQCIQSIDDIKDKFYLIDEEAGKLLTTNLVEDMVIDDDCRYLDIVCDEIPMGVQLGDYVDIRISFTLGQDFIALTHKRVVGMSSNVLKLIVDQKDIQVYQSMVVDKAVYSGTKVYAIQYIEGGIQESSDDYYPIRLEDLTTMLQDPNIKNANLKSLSLVDRDNLEKTLNKNNDALRELLSAVSGAKGQLTSEFKTAKAAYEKALAEAEEAEKAEAEGIDASQSSSEVADGAIRIN